MENDFHTSEKNVNALELSEEKDFYSSMQVRHINCIGSWLKYFETNVNLIITSLRGHNTLLVPSLLHYKKNGSSMC